MIVRKVSAWFLLMSVKIIKVQLGENDRVLKIVHLVGEVFGFYGELNLFCSIFYTEPFRPKYGP